MKAARVHERGKIVIEDVPIPEVNEKEVLIAVHRVGICGTDVGVVDGHVSAKYPVTLGHEYSGVVAKLGSPSVMPHLKEGDPVVSGGGWGCGECELCRQGHGPVLQEPALPGPKRGRLHGRVHQGGLPGRRANCRPPFPSTRHRTSSTSAAPSGPSENSTCEDQDGRGHRAGQRRADHPPAPEDGRRGEGRDGRDPGFPSRDGPAFRRR